MRFAKDMYPENGPEAVHRLKDATSWKKLQDMICSPLPLGDDDLAIGHMAQDGGHHGNAMVVARRDRLLPSPCPVMCMASSSNRPQCPIAAMWC
jgi:hypothetical protein